MSFSHDESLSYTIANGDPTWKSTANNHPLNTRLMRWLLRHAGPAEWSLRAPNLLAHVLYLGFGLLLLYQLRSPWMMLAGFSLLNLNPFVLDFFSVARGYGLALGFTLGALYFFRRGFVEERLWPSALSFLVSLVFIAFADLANFSWVTVCIYHCGFVH